MGKNIYAGHMTFYNMRKHTQVDFLEYTFAVTSAIFFGIKYSNFVNLHPKF